MVDYRTKTCILTHAPRACERGTRHLEYFSDATSNKLRLARFG